MVTAADDTKCIIWQAETVRKSSFQTACEGIMDVNKEEAREMQAWTAALNEETDNKERR